MVGDVGRLLQVWQTGSVSQPEEMAGGGVVEEAGGNLKHLSAMEEVYSCA